MTDSLRKREYAGAPIKDLRRQDRTPPLAKLPGKAKGGKARKIYGYTYQRRSIQLRHVLKRKWRTVTHYAWYATERQRDDAMRTAGGMYRSYYEIRNVTPITRGEKPRSGDT